MFADYLERLSAAAADGQEISMWAAAMAELGFNRHMYGVRAPGIDGAGEHLIESTSFSEDWLNSYVGDGLYVNDPILERSTRDLTPFTWAACPGKTRKTRQFIGMAADAGLAYGISASLVLGDGYHGAVSVCGDHSADEDHVLMSVYAMTSAMHALHVQNRAKETQNSTRLTQRELEVLRWMADGKTDWEIGGILSISENTVRFHTKHIFKKLQVNTRLHAAVKAHMMGIADISHMSL